LYRFSQSLPYLLARLGVRMGELFSRELARDGLTLSMYRVLAALAEQGGPQRLGELATLTSIETSTLSRLATEMQRRGYLTRDRPESDQRSLAVGLTTEGETLAARLMRRAAHYEHSATGDLSPAAAGALKTALIQVYRNLDALEQEIDAADTERNVTPLRPERRRAK
jgi:DNA-binding MarR family transcriptional regulator